MEVSAPSKWQNATSSVRRVFRCLRSHANGLAARGNRTLNFSKNAGNIRVRVKPRHIAWTAKPVAATLGFPESPGLLVHHGIATRLETGVACFLSGFPSVDHVLVNVGDSLLAGGRLVGRAGTQSTGSAQNQDQCAGHGNGFVMDGFHRTGRRWVIFPILAERFSVEAELWELREASVAVRPARARACGSATMSACECCQNEWPAARHPASGSRDW
jgi:hypothetical protein